MIDIQYNFPLQSQNTFGLKVKAAAYSSITDEKQLPELSKNSGFQKGIFVLGGGSNILFLEDIKEWVWHNQIGGIKTINEDKNFVNVKVGGGVIWHDFVRYAVAKNLGGIENLSLIPGSVGAAPIQNIGAYGVEARQVITRVNAWHIYEQKKYTFSNESCQFGYRDSIFKNAYKGKFIITSVEFRLSKKPKFNVEYGTIRQELTKMGITTLSVKAVSDAVIRIRQEKLPNPEIIGNAGSFFKNPVINNRLFNKLQTVNPALPGYLVDEEHTKVPAAWLIEQCGWKGYKENNIGVHPRQALVLVNYGGAEGKSIFQLSEKIIHSVREKFGITLEREVQIYAPI